MIYPKFIKEKSIIGVTAPSAGPRDEIDKIRIKNAINNFENLGFKVITTDNCYTNEGIRSSIDIVRKKELESLYLNSQVKAIICLTGGEYLMEILSILDFDIIKNNPKWIQGYSDPTGLLFLITTNLDVATIYGNNFKAFSMKNLHKSLIDNIEMLKGNLIKQESFKLYEKEKIECVNGDEEYLLTEKVKWETLDTKDAKFEGRIIGGCLDVLLNLIGTRFDKTKDFVLKYKNDGIIWYFDNYGLTNEDIERAMWQFKEAGWFDNTKGIIFGRNNMNDESSYITLKEALKESLSILNIPVVMGADIGHVSPRMTIINGAIAKVSIHNNHGSVKFCLK